KPEQSPSSAARGVGRHQSVPPPHGATCTSFSDPARDPAREHLCPPLTPPTARISKAGDAIMSALAGARWWTQGQITALGNERGVRAMSMTQLLFSFQGRLNRKPYWTMAITTTVVFLLLLLLAVATLREYGLEFLLVTIAILVILYIPL